MTVSSRRSDLQGTQWQPRAQDELLIVRDEPLQPGETLGRYVVLFRLGAGGMGVVYAAYDPELDRKLALKLLRRGSSDPERRKRAQERLLAEARAMARLNHPHVITVHDVAIFEGRVFVAMEFVDGASLTVALASRRRSWREILDLLIPAGRGLAAAHEAGLVHRDFKPDNVMVAKDGRVLVTDFGLARALDPEADSSRHRIPVAARGRPSTIDSDSHSSVEPNQQPSRFAGTPAYMAPEQRAGQTIDARSDQFSFCVTLYEALYGERPFAGDDSKSLQEAILNKQVRCAPQHSKVPQWLRTVLLRGLAPRPEDRWPSMQRLLQALNRDPRVRWQRAINWSVGVTALTTLGVGLHLVNSSQGRPCSYGQQRIDEIWNAASREAGRAAFVRTKKPYAASSWQAVESEIGSYSELWVEAHRDACEATHVRQEQSDALFDLRMNCLERRYDELQTLIEVMQGADVDLVKAATVSTSSLIPISVCQDIERLRTPLPLPDDPGQQRAIQDVRSAMSRARVYGDARQYGPGLELAKTQLEKARTLGHLPLLAEALALNGLLARGQGKLKEAQTYLREALEVAGRARHDIIVAEVLMELIVTMRFSQESWDRAEELTHIARAAVARAGDSLDHRIKLATAEGALAMQREQPELARAKFEEALVLARKLEPTDQGRIAQALNNVAVIASQQFDHETADGHLRQALEIYERRLGAEHPVTASMRINLAFVKTRLGELDEAQRLLEVALQIAERNDSGEPRVLVSALSGLGTLAHARADFETAEEHLRRSIALAQAQDEAPAVLAPNLLALSHVLVDGDEPEQAVETALDALELAKTAFGDEHIVYVGALCALGRSYVASGERERARGYLEEALPGLREPIDPVARGRCRGALAAAIGTRDPKRAAQLVEAARREIDGAGADAPLAVLARRELEHGGSTPAK